MGVQGTWRSVINEVCRSLRADFARWQERSLQGHQAMYLFLDGIYLKLRPEDKRPIAVLCAYAMGWDGRRVLLHLAIGDKESGACWEAFIEEMKGRGLNEPFLCVIDGNVGLHQAVRRKFAGSLVQRCQVHKMRNIINKLPHLARPTLKKRIYKAFTAKSYKEGWEQAQKIIPRFTSEASGLSLVFAVL